MLTLICHPDTPAKRVTAITVVVYATDGEDALIEFTIGGVEELVIPALASPSRRAGIWQTTCCEAFFRTPGAQKYWEFNFSPSGEWAAYVFDTYRDGMNECMVAVEPHIECLQENGQLVVEVDVDFCGLPPGPLEMALSVVIEETDGTKSYWALAHPPGKPDFHHSACFAARLAAPEAP